VLLGPSLFEANGFSKHRWTISNQLSSILFFFIARLDGDVRVGSQAALRQSACKCGGGLPTLIVLNGRDVKRTFSED